MAYDQNNKKDKAQQTRDLFKKYSLNRETWARHAQEDDEFRLGKQWTSEQRRILESRGQAALVGAKPCRKKSFDPEKKEKNSFTKKVLDWMIQ